MENCLEGVKRFRENHRRTWRMSLVAVGILSVIGSTRDAPHERELTAQLARWDALCQCYGANADFVDLSYRFAQGSRDSAVAQQIAQSSQEMLTDDLPANDQTARELLRAGIIEEMDEAEESFDPLEIVGLLGYIAIMVGLVDKKSSRRE